MSTHLRRISSVSEANWRTKWYHMRMCIVALWWVGFIANFIAAWLSMLMDTGDASFWALWTGGPYLKPRSASWIKLRKADALENHCFSRNRELSSFSFNLRSWVFRYPGKLAEKRCSIWVLNHGLDFRTKNDEGTGNNTWPKFYFCNRRNMSLCVGEGKTRNGPLMSQN